MRSVAILNSRQSLQPHGALPWVSKTQAAVAWAGSHGLSIKSSLGLQTYELVTYLAASFALPTHLIVQNPSLRAHEICEQYGFNPSLLTVEYVESDDRQRDHMVIDRAAQLIPISVRTEGNIERMIAQAERQGKPVNRTFQVPYHGREETLAYTVTSNDLSDEIKNWSEEFLIHWTRATHGPWPGEEARAYYHDIVQSTDYPRTAFHTLRRIVREQTIRASDFHMARGVSAVSFSSLPPCEVAPLIRWRARYRQMSFEPYGVGIRASCADKLGIVPVIYSDESVPEGDMWRHQSIGQITDWRTEREYRHRGTIDLRGIRQDDMVLVTRYADEALLIKNETGLRSISFTKYNSTD